MDTKGVERHENQGLTMELSSSRREEYNPYQNGKPTNALSSRNAIVPNCSTGNSHILAMKKKIGIINMLVSFPFLFSPAQRGTR